MGAQEGGLVKGMKLIDNAAKYYEEYPLQKDMFDVKKVEVSYTDNMSDFYDFKSNKGNLQLKIEKTDIENLKSPWRIHISGINKKKAIKKIDVYPSKYSLHSFTIGNIESNKIKTMSLCGLSKISIELNPLVPDRVLNSCILSCHDEGWEGFSYTENPYVAEGSRCLFGYSFLFTPAIPIFMGGEEFNAEYTPLPTLSYHLYDKKRIGKGKWLYGSWIQWNQLKLKKHQDMLTDVKKMIAIRKQEKDVIHSVYNDAKPNIIEVHYKSTSVLPVPYILWNENKAILIAGNNYDKDVELTVTLPLSKIGFNSVDKIRISDLWNGGSQVIDVKKSSDFTFTIKKDKVLNGGISIYKIEKNL